ncbi:Aspartyl/glutamyl-tRNA(Asn/Gln) amidotransferase subunit C [bioreactor metagenome]|uniref:Aspartyl/glutamyl-tRNA(Asn/Gln) amidotransferase subunit C n=1 Tax=bioreactor metagenome TaxID=1076179 RepID=A0A645HTV4_9ZZZZ
MTDKELINYSNIIQIELSKSKQDDLLPQINNILDYVSILDNYNCQEQTNLLDNNQEDNYNRFREDIPVASISLQDALKNAHSKNESFFKVPKVIE